MQTVDHPAGQQPEQHKAESGLTVGQIAFRVMAGLVVVASFAVWVYAYSGMADRDAPDLLADTTLASTAEGLCAAAVADVAAMPNALDAVDGADRADQIRATSARFQTMIDALRGLDVDQAVGNPARDEQIYRAWLADWQVLIEDRLDYASRIAVDPDAVFYITDTGVGERLDKRITRFANTNSMVSCASPTDV